MFCRNNRLFLSAVNKNNLKHICEIRERKNHTNKFILVHSYTKSYIQSPETTGNPLCNQNQITHITHQRSDLDPLKTHTSFGSAHTPPRMLILTTSRAHNLSWIYNTRNTVIKEEGNRIHLGITKLKVQNYNPILFHTLKNDPKLFQILEKLF